MQRQFKDAVRKAAIPKPATSHCMHHCVATHPLQSGTDIRTVQDLMGHARVETTMIYLHVMQRPVRVARARSTSPEAPSFIPIPHFLLGKASKEG